MRPVLILLLLCLFAAPCWAQQYTVVKGDTLSTIAKRHKCSVSDLEAANPKVSSSLSIGQKLKLPRACRKQTTSRSKAGTSSKGKSAVVKPHKPRSVPKGTIDSTVLGDLMASHGFHIPKRFKAVVVDITLNKSGKRIIKENWFGFRQTADLADDWNPGSTVKIFSALAAALQLKKRGFDTRATAGFHDPNGVVRSYKVSQLITDALQVSDNLAHNRLVQLAGHDYLNGTVLKRLKQAGIHKAYQQPDWMKLTGGDEWLRNSPKIEVRLGPKRVTFKERYGTANTFACAYSSACATPADLVRVMRRIMLHEQLPPAERYNLGTYELRTMRNALKAHRKRGMEAVEGIEAAFKPDEVVIFHKPGFAGDWMSDIIYVYKKNSNKRWLVMIAAFPGRESVVRAGQVIGQILANNELE